MIADQRDLARELLSRAQDDRAAAAGTIERAAFGLATAAIAWAQGLLGN